MRSPHHANISHKSKKVRNRRRYTYAKKYKDEPEEEVFTQRLFWIVFICVVVVVYLYKLIVA